MLCLGDSITFGWGVRYEEAYPTLLAEHARLFVRESLLTLSATYRVLSYTLRRDSHRSVRQERKKTQARLPRMPLEDYKARLRDMVELARASEIDPGTDRGAQTARP